MRVVEITQGYFTHGAVMRRARQETIALLKAGHEVIAITDLKWRSALHEMHDYRRKLLIIPLKSIYIHRPFRKISSQLSFTIKLYFALKKIERQKQIDLIVSHMSTLCLAVGRISNKYNIVSAWLIQDYIKDRMETGNPYNWMETLLLLYTDKYALRNLTYILPVSKYIKKLVLLDGANPKNTIVKYNAVNTEIFTPGTPVKKDIDILFVGRLSIEKGVNILIESSKFFSNEKQILIIGEGPLRKYLEKQANKISKNIKFEGFVDHDNIPKFVRRAKILVAPSLSECHAAVPIEAMACGVPVIASNVAGMADTIQDEISGWILKKNTPKELGNLISRVLAENEKIEEIGKAAIRRANFFSEKKFEKSIVEFFEKIVQKDQDLS